MRVRELEVGQRVGVAVMASSYGPDRSLGIFRVTKKNKVRIVLERETDGYQVQFSARLWHRLLGDGQVSYNTYVESVEAQQAREQHKAKRDEIRQAWTQFEQATKGRQIAELQVLLDQIQQLESELEAISE